VVCGPVRRDPMDSVYWHVDPVYAFSNRKLIQLIWKFARARLFYKNTLELFENYILVPVILHLGPYLTLYNYN
jgi:hypothetical protein